MTVPIGKALEGIEINLFNEDGTETAAGQTGEIALRGEYISPSYWTGTSIEQYGLDRDGWFCTGDLGRCDADGVFEHLGRKDDQLKLRGHWISAAEIEAALMQVPGVREAAVVASRKRISAFVSTNNGHLAPEEMRSALQQRLPAYSMPHDIFQLSQLPALPNGKIDRAALSRETTQRLAKRQAKTSPSPDALIFQLVCLWRKILETDKIDINADFFSLGGDSLAAATMFAAVETLFGINLPVSALMEAPTIEKLAELIRKGGWSENKLRLVGLQLRGSKLPLYCVPGAGSEALAVRELAADLGDDQPFFAFQPQGLDGCTPYLRSIEDMASHYLETLRAHQPRGPYRLCGSSLGGVVAFEMARRLAQDGEEINFLGLFDTYGGEYPNPKRDLSIKQKLKLAGQSLVPAAERDNLTFRALRKGVSDWLQRKIVNLDLRFNFRSHPLPYRLRFIYLQEVCFAARPRYRLQPFPGKVHLFRVEHQPSPELFERDQFLGWHGMALDGIEVHDLPGYHGHHLREPTVRILAHQLRTCLDSDGV